MRPYNRSEKRIYTEERKEYIRFSKLPQIALVLLQLKSLRVDLREKPCIRLI